ncbi:hypothetical protein ACQPZQ_02365 [Pseudonocardia sp. CA-142604]|uniref:hypothetical protein n=1 Tax=Pseudonocardia sp. CA-142604 TaxID=3240024 RepID=UPI003D8B5CDB
MAEQENGAGGRELERTRRTVAKLELQLREQAGALLEVRGLVKELAGDVSRALETATPGAGETARDGAGDGDESGEPPALVSWLEVEDPAVAQIAMANLVPWLERVYLAYPDSALPVCWLWHPDAVEELLALRVAHWDAYSGKRANAAAAVDWHDRHRPRVSERIKKRHGGCVLAKHVMGKAQKARSAALKGASQRVAGHWAVEHEVPAPVRSEIEEADAGVGR